MDTGERSGPMAAFAAIRDAGAKVGKSVDDRYSDTATYNSLINNRRLLHAVCLAAFGYDFIPELDEAVSIQGGGFAINSTALVPVATRRLAKINTQDDGKVTFIYNVGYFLSTGANVNWRVEMMCSNDYSCSASERFDGGRCDCAYEQNQNSADFQNPYTIDSGYAAGGTTVGDGDGNGNIYREITAPIRYDKVRLVWTDTTGGNMSGATGWKDISSIGDVLPVSCYFSLLSFQFACDHSADNEYGDVYFVSPRVSLNNANGVYYNGDSLIVTVYAAQDFTDIESSKQVQKYAKATLKKGSTKLKEWTTLHGALETSPVVFSDFTFGSGEVADIEYGLSSQGQKLWGGNNLVIKSTAAVTSDTKQAVYIRANCVEGTVSTTDTTKFKVDDKNYCEFEYKVDTSVDDSGNLVSSKDSWADVTGTTRKAVVTQNTGEDTILNLDIGNIRLTIDKSYTSFATGDNLYLKFSKEVTTSESTAICPAGTETSTLTLTVSLHDGVSLYSGSEPNPYEGQPSSVVFTYDDEPQTEDITITVKCTETASSVGSSVSLDKPTTSCTLNQPTTQSRNCLCGDDNPLFGLTNSDTSVKICTSLVDKTEKTLCEIGGNAVDGCVCASTSVTQLANPTNICSAGQVCEQNPAGSGTFTCSTPAS